MIINYYSTNHELNSPKKQIPKWLICLFLSFHFLFGYDFGFMEFIEDGKLRLLVKFVKNLSAVICASILAAFIGFAELSNYWFCFNLTQYSMCFIVLAATKYNLYSFLKDFYELESNCSVTRKTRVGTIVIVYILLGSGIKISAFIAECIDGGYSLFECALGIVPFLFYIPPYLSVDIISLVLILSYYHIYTFIKCLKEAYFKSEINLDYLQKNYVAVLDCFDKIKPLYDNLLMVEMFNDVPKYMGIIYFIQRFIQMEISWLFYVGEGTFCAHIALQIFLPALLAEMLHSQLDSLRLFLHQQLLREKDEKKGLEKMRFLRYMEARCLRHKAWRIVPVDMHLPLILLDFCTTYTIVLVQLTHVYD